MLAQFLARAHTGMVKGGVAEMREKADGSGRLLWRLAPGVVGTIGDCGAGWCQFDVNGRKGYAQQAAIWGQGHRNAAPRHFLAGQTSSIASAVASPPPMHRLATPLVLPWRFSAPISVVTMRVPLAPIGWPSAWRRRGR
jgi:hypothetical protein